MTVRISGKHVDIGESLRDHVTARVDDALGKYFDGGYSGHVTVEREGVGFKTECKLHLDTGIMLAASGKGGDAYSSFDDAAGHIEKRLRRYKRRIKDHNRPDGRAGSLAATYQVLAAPGDEEEELVSDAPVVIAETTTEVKTMSVGEAVMDLDLRGTPALVFRHAGHGGINVVYRRADGNIGWIDPELVNAGDA